MLTLDHILCQVSQTATPHQSAKHVTTEPIQSNNKHIRPGGNVSQKKQKKQVQHRRLSVFPKRVWNTFNSTKRHVHHQLNRRLVRLTHTPVRIRRSLSLSLLPNKTKTYVSYTRYNVKVILLWTTHSKSREKHTHRCRHKTHKRNLYLSSYRGITYLPVSISFSSIDNKISRHC